MVKKIILETKNDEERALLSKMLYQIEDRKYLKVNIKVKKGIWRHMIIVNVEDTLDKLRSDEEFVIKMITALFDVKTVDTYVDDVTLEDKEEKEETK